MFRISLIILFSIVFIFRMNAQSIIDLCVGETHNFSIPYTSGSIYTWKLSNTFYSTIISDSDTEHIVISLDSVGIFKLYVEEYNSSGCIGYDSVLIQVHENPMPKILADGPIEVCKGTDVLLYLDEPDLYDSYLWTDGSSGSELLISSTGEYSVVVSNEFGCTNNSNTISVNIDADLNADFSIEGFCLNRPTNFISTSFSSGSSIISYRWDFGDGAFAYTDSVLHLYNELGEYEISLLIETDIGCKDLESRYLTVFDNPEADFTYSPFSVSTLNSEVNFINHSMNISSYVWVFDDSIYSFVENPSYIYEDPGVHDVLLVVEDVNECVDSISKYIMVYYDFVLHVPNAFTPNNDGDNDAFSPQGLRMNKYQEYELCIYNKWGDVIFKTQDINDSWEAKDNPNGVYNWVVIITDELGAVRKMTGVVTVIK